MKKVLLVGFTHIQIELARKFLKYRNLSSAIELLPEQQSSVPVDAYVVNGDDASVASRSTMSANGFIRSSLTTFMGLPGRSIVATRMPSSPRSREIALLMFVTPVR